FMNQGFCYTGIDARPDIDNLVVTFVIGNKTHVIVIPNLIYFFLCSSYQLSFYFRNGKVVDTERQTTTEGRTESECVGVIQEFNRLRNIGIFQDRTDDFTQ